jgi:hypothetical protein
LHCFVLDYPTKSQDKSSHVNMKLTLALLTAVVPASVGAFGITGPAAFTSRGGSTVALFASKNAKKIASRTEWAAARGVGAAAGTVDGAAAAAGMRENAAGLEFVKLVHPETGATSEIYLYGGVVTSYKDGEGTEFIAVRPDAKMDGSKPISGGLSHCWPQVCTAVFFVL